MARYTAAMTYFSARQLIIDHLQAEAVKASVKCRVLPVAGWKQALEQLQAVPGLFIWYQTERVPGGETGRRQNGKRQIVDQVWNVVVGVKNVADSAGANAQDDAEPIIAIMQTLQGAKLSAEHGHFYRRQSQFQAAYVNGFGVYPFAFETRIFT